MDRDLKLNSIDRYVKSSPRFVLEEHGHCEVPAGCGGAVLRWRDPRNEIPVHLELSLVGAGIEAALVDGLQVRTTRLLLAPGRHEVTVDLVANDGATAQLLFIARVEEPPDAMPLLISWEGQGWQWAPLAEAGHEEAGHEEAGAWRPLVPGELPAGEKPAYSVQKLLEAGAEPLTTPGRVSRLRLRATFDVPAGG